MLYIKTSSAGIGSGILSKHHPADVHSARNINRDEQSGGTTNLQLHLRAQGKEIVIGTPFA